MSNITKALLHCGTICKTEPLYQYDYGQILQIVGVELPEAYEVHFSNHPHGVATTQIGSADGVTIPDMYLLSGETVYAWLFLHAGEDDGETEYSITIPVIRRASISDDPPTPVEQSVIEQAITALNNAVEQTAQDVVDAVAAKDAAETAQGLAEGARDAAIEAKLDAVDAEADAIIAKSAAQAAQTAAESAAASASASASVAGDARDAAVTAKAGAESAASTATAAKTAAQAAKAAAETAQGKAETAQSGAESAKAAAQTAQGQAQTAKTAAETAQGKAETAQGKAEDAQGAAETAQAAAEAALAEFTGVTAQATTLAPGSSATASYSAGVLALGIPQGIQGENGESGVYYGTTAPTDPDINVWIDPNGTSDPDIEELKDDVDELKSEFNPVLEETKPWELYEERGTNATEGGSSTNNTFTKTLKASGDYDYKIKLKSSIALSADTNIYFRHATNGNLNLICTMLQGETERTVYIRPTSDCTIIRWNIADSGARYTSTVYERGSAVENLEGAIEDTNEELDEVEAGLIHYNPVAQKTATAATSSTSVTASLNKQLTANTVYRVNIKSSSALGADCNVYYRDTVAGSNRNFIGAIKKDETEWTFDVAPNNTADAIRINSGNATTYTITVTLPVNAITDIYHRIEGDNTYDIPSYWETELADSVTKIKANQLLIGENGVEFFFITDTHWDSNAQHSNFLLEYLTKECRIPSVVFGGDAIKTYNVTKAGAVGELRTFYHAFDMNYDFRTTIGNHDTNSISNSDSSTYLSEGEMYALMLRMDERIAQEDPAVLSGYWDNPSQKVRYINVYKIYPQIDEDVQAWVDERITELPAGWKVIMFSHAVYESLSEGQPHIPSSSAAVVQHFANLSANAEIICWIVGHCHYDATDNSNGLLVISTQTDNYTMSDMYGGATMTLGTNTEQAFDCYQIDTQNKVIYITRVGAGNDRQVSYGS